MTRNILRVYYSSQTLIFHYILCPNNIVNKNREFEEQIDGKLTNIKA